MDELVGRAAAQEHSLQDENARAKREAHRDSRRLSRPPRWAALMAFSAPTTIVKSIVSLAMALIKPAACLCLLALVCMAAGMPTQNFTLPELGYPYESLEPAISNMTMVRPADQLHVA